MDNNRDNNCRTTDFESKSPRCFDGIKFIFVQGGGCSKCAFSLGGPFQDHCNKSSCLDMLDGYYVKASDIDPPEMLLNAIELTPV